MEKKITKARERNYRCLEQVIGCKWSVSVLRCVELGVNRPGALEREIEGISKKVLAERLRKLSNYGLLNKKVFPEVPPRTEYSLTGKGRRLVEILGAIRTLDAGSGED